MDLGNHTPFVALAYDVLDPRGEQSHVVAVRGTYDLRPAVDAGADVTHCAELAEEQGDLVVSDAYHGEMNRSSVRVESDLAQHKPRCDVIVLGAAHSPTGAAVARVDVGVRIVREKALQEGIEAGTLLDHHLAVHGARAFERRGDGWALGDAEPFVELALRYEHAFGGELKVYAEDEAAKRVGDEHRLPDEVRRAHPEGEAAPVAHTTCAWNPVGVGFLQRWYAEAAEVERWPAPRIEAPGAGISAEVFARLVRGEVEPGALPELSPRGVGVIAKPWQPRLRLAGTFDDRWRAEVWPLMPADFDMAYWNGAHPDMQCAHLFGREVVELSNMLPPTAPGVGREGGRTVCRFRVPAADAFVMLTAKGGATTFATLPIDTITIDLAAMRVSLVWRHMVAKAREIEATQVMAIAHMTRIGV